MYFIIFICFFIFQRLSELYIAKQNQKWLLQQGAVEYGREHYSSLGKYWNTRIFRVPGSVPVAKGPFKFLRHPNYVEVICEIAVIPLIFHLYYTAVIFTVLNAIMLAVRIRVENRVWNE
ncbi:MAG: hypothetical protein EOP46_02465 [Sphingobacteriaceae bacterium]|nr:MAG: hypothetical protein EOP46_02465 [Sphingobacteriaceae bacterium]